MGWIKDALSEVPLSAVLKERVELADQKYEQAEREAEGLRKKIAALETENNELREKVLSENADGLSDETVQVLLFLFRNEEGRSGDKTLAQNLQLQLSVAKFHLEELNARNLAASRASNYLTGEKYWSLTPQGRRYVIENQLH